MKDFPLMFERQPLSLWFSVGILALIVGAVWYYSTPRNRAPAADFRTAIIDTAASRLRVQGESDEIEAIAADLRATDLRDLDAELNDIDAELGR